MDKERLKNLKLPISNCEFWDTHCHLDYLKSDTIKNIVSNAVNNGVSKIITIGVEASNQTTVLEIANNYSNVLCTQGIHPHEAKEYNDNIEALIIKNCSSPKVVAIGEIGLDYHYNHSEPATQRSVFERQLDLANRLSMPVIIHTREAENDTIDILNNFKYSKNLTILFHSYTSNSTLTKYIIDKGHYVGFNGILTFPNAHDVRETLRQIPTNRLVLETDGPFLAPIPFRGKENLPQYIPYIACAVADLKQTSIEDIANNTSQNAKVFFNRIS